jgi:hypothetical protein
MITADYLRELNHCSGGKLEIAAKIMGYAHHKSIMKLFAKHGIEWDSCRNFEYQGAYSTFIGHCRRLGVSHHAAEVMKCRKRWTHIQTLDYYTTKHRGQA